MQLINSSAFRDSVSEGITRLLPQHAPYADLCAKMWTELAVHPDGFTLYTRANPRIGLMQARLLSAGAEATKVLAKLAPGSRLLVSIDTAMCFESSEKVPFLSDTKTTAILSLSNLRTLPMNQDEFVWGWFRDTQTQNLNKCKKLILKRSVLRAILSEIEKSGAKCEALVFRPHGEAAYPIALTPVGKAFNQDRFRRWSKGLVTAVAGLCAAGTIFVATMFMRQGHDAEAIAQSVAELARDAKTLKEHMAADRALRQAGTELHARKTGEIQKIALLNEVTAVLPDDAYVTNILMEGNTLSIDGIAQSPESLVAVLEASKLIKDVAFTGPVTRNPGEEKSRFSMRMTMESPYGTKSP